jgi:hypothetical protein
MKILAAIAIAVTMETVGYTQQVSVYVQGLSVVPARVWCQAEGLADQIFARAGVTVHWHLGEPSRFRLDQERPIVAEMLATPSQLKPGVLAFARPYEGVHIDVFYDRVRAATEPELTPNVLAHVLVHEITHVLQGTCRHSETGVMKAHWTLQDYQEMRMKPLSFTEEDVQLIRFGVARRAIGGELITSTPTH